ncbi:MAG: PorV/PorQ family protein [Bacteroidetes bacterium]|nr:PorV/PorQ family protein [Bacteroidota bacterium]
MKITIKFLIIAAILLLGVNSMYAGGGVRNGTGGATQLLIPVGSRGIAMGGSSVATTTGIEALFWNPAGAADMSNSATLLFSHMNYIADIGVEYGAVSANFEGFGVVSLNVKSLAIGSINVTTNDQPDGTGQTFTPQMLTAGATYSRQLTDRIAIGVTFSYISEAIDQVNAVGFAFNAGVLYKDMGDINGLNFGIVMKNIGPQMSYSGPGMLVKAAPQGYNRPPSYYQIETAAFDLPSAFEVGLGYKPVIDEMNSMQISASFASNNFSGDVYNIGAEYGYNQLFFVRGGYTLSPKDQDPDYIYGFTAGAGINYDISGVNFKIDYAYRGVKYFGGNHIFSVSLGF